MIRKHTFKHPLNQSSIAAKVAQHAEIAFSTDNREGEGRGKWFGDVPASSLMYLLRDNKMYLVCLYLGSIRLASFLADAGCDSIGAIRIPMSL